MYGYSPYIYIYIKETCSIFTNEITAIFYSALQIADVGSKLLVVSCNECCLVWSESFIDGSQTFLRHLWCSKSDKQITWDVENDWKASFGIISNEKWNRLPSPAFCCIDVSPKFLISQTYYDFVSAYLGL